MPYQRIGLRIKKTDAVLRKLETARKSLRASLETAPDEIDMDLARACDDLSRAVHNIEYSRQQMLWRIEQIERERMNHD